MQKRKNIKLLIALSVLVIITIGTWFMLQRDDYSTISDPGLFAMEDVSQVDSVVLNKVDEQVILHFENGLWKVNDKNEADPQKLTVLFAVLNQIRAKRPVAEAEQAVVDSLFSEQGVEVMFYQEGVRVKNFKVTGNETRGLTYFSTEDEMYVVNIPGYRSYLAKLFQMENTGWRDRLIFNDVSWNNLERVEVTYPESDGFIIRPEKNYFYVEGVSATDSLKLLDYLDRTSLLVADEFLSKNAADTIIIQNQPLLINIAVFDIRRKPFDLTVFDQGIGGSYLAVKDSTDWMLINRKKIEPLLQKESFFGRN